VTAHDWRRACVRKNVKGTVHSTKRKWGPLHQSLGGVEKRRQTNVGTERLCIKKIEQERNRGEERIKTLQMVLL